MTTGRNKKSVAFQVDSAGDRPRMNSNSVSNTNLNDLRQDSSSSSSSSRFHKPMSECCYSISNLALIIASILAIVFLVQFIQDDPLYEYGEHLLTLRFYRQLIYMLVVLPLVLLIPAFNATSALCLSSSSSSSSGAHHQLARPILTAKTFYQFLMLILVFIALVFVAPSIRTSSVASQVELELRKHMRFRYENTFSYDFLDRLQEEYECCDELWYRANMDDHLPTSCFVRNTAFSLIHDQTCSEAIGTLVSTRCMVIATCLVILLVALACLMVVDVAELVSMSASARQSYDFRAANEAKLVGGGGGGGGGGSGPNDEDSASHRSGSSSLNSFSSGSRRDRDQTAAKTGQSAAAAPVDCANYLDANRRALLGQAIPVEVEQPRREAAAPNRLRSSERLADLPLLVADHHLDDDESAGVGQQQQRQRQQQPQPTILTRANYNLVERDRSQSPLFVGSTLERTTTATATALATTTCTATASSSPGSSRRPIKSALKRSPSSQRMDSSPSSSSSVSLNNQHQHLDERPLQARTGVHEEPRRGQQPDQEEDADSLLDYAERLRSNSSSLIRRQRQEQHRDHQHLQQARRSPLNVRFADQ